METPAACLGDIPAAVIADIVSYCIPENEDIPQQLKATLQFGFINRHWHRAVLPLANRYVCFEHGMPDMLALRSKDADKIKCERQEACTRSNIAFVTHIDNVTCVHLAVYCLRTPLEGLEKLLSHMATFSAEWRGITRLEVSISVNSYLTVWRTQDTSKYTADIETLCQTIEGLMPNVQSISARGSSLHPVVKELCSEMAKRYSSKLTSLSTNIPLAVPRKHIFTSLAFVNIDLKRIHEFQMPHISAKSIVKLKVAGNVDNLNWNLFAVDSSDEVILPNLQFLELDFAYKSRAYGGSGLEATQRKAYLPKLKILKLTTTASECRFFRLTRLPCKMDCLQVLAPGSVVRSLEKCGMPQVDNLLIDQHRPSDHKDQTTHRLSTASLTTVLFDVVDSRISDDSVSSDDTARHRQSQIHKRIGQVFISKSISSHSHIMTQTRAEQESRPRRKASFSKSSSKHGSSSNSSNDRKHSKAKQLAPLDTSSAVLKGAERETDHLATPTDSNPERSDGSLDGTAKAEDTAATLAHAGAYITDAAAGSYCSAHPTAANSSTAQHTPLGSGPPSPTGSETRVLPLAADGDSKQRVPTPPSPALATPPLTASVPHSAASSLVSPQLTAQMPAIAETETPHEASTAAAGETERAADGNNQMPINRHEADPQPLPAANEVCANALDEGQSSRPQSSLVLVAATEENSRPVRSRETNWFRRQSKSSSFSGLLSPSSKDEATPPHHETLLLRAQAQRDASMAEASVLQQKLSELRRSTDAEIARLRAELDTATRKLQTEYELRTAAEAKCSVMECELAELSSNIQFEAQNLVAQERRRHKSELERAARTHREVVQLMEMERAQVGSLKLSLERTTTALDREREECERLRSGMAAFERQFSTLLGTSALRQADFPSTLQRCLSPEASPSNRQSRSAPQSLENASLMRGELARTALDPHIVGHMFFGNDAARPDTRLTEFLGFVNVASEKEAQASAFMQRSLREDVGPTLTADSAGMSSLTAWTKNRRLLHCVQDTTLVLESFVPRLQVGRIVSVGCYLCGSSATRTSLAESRHSGRSQPGEMYRMRFGDDDTDNKPLCMHCHLRMVSVCSFFSYLKNVRRGLIKRPIAEIWLEVNRARLQMWLARSGASPDSHLQIA
ncbi:RAB3A interacting protein [Coemansia sp. RSA 2336]|nr:RAB3A interacting protein [Coemansia sp. RSA 2336]